MKKCWIAWVLCGLGCVAAWAATPSTSSTPSTQAGKRAEGKLPLDMSIEWVPYVRPSIPSQQRNASEPSQPNAPMGRSQIWTLLPDDRRLSMVLQRWCVEADWQLVWEAERDFPIEVGIQLEGYFSSALEEVVKSLADSDYPLQAVMNEQTRVLRIRRQHEVSR